VVGRLNPYFLSASIHMAAAAAFLAAGWLPRRSLETAEFTVIESPSSAPIRLSPQTPIRSERDLPRAVFGISRNTLLESAPSDSSPPVAVKAGNTLAVAPDDRVLRPEDVGSLPIPTEEYLLTEMPRPIAEIRIPYPKEARAKGIEGGVSIDLLIDEDGNVRDARLLNGPGGGLDEAALEAVRRLRFRPAKVKEKPVAVRIRYLYRFVLES
jgi:protein TonB